MLTTGVFPDSWKKATIKMLHKKGKEITEASSYRPISLTSCMSKLYETVIRTRLIKRLSRLKEENIHQAGYKKNRSAQEHLLRLSEDISEGFMKRQSTIAVFLDVQGAFDKVWSNGLIYKLIQVGLPKYLLRLIASFLKNRQLSVKSGSKISRTVEMECGTPQGCVLSPLLYNFLVDDLKDKLGKDIRIAQYADDVCVWVTEACPRIAEWKLQKALKEIDAWTRKWRVTLAPEKTNLVVFSRCSTHQRMKINLELGGKILQEKSEARLLGVLFDNRLSWQKYREELLRRVGHKIWVLKKLSAKSRWTRPDVALKFFDAIIVPVWTYGSLLFSSNSEEFWKGFRSCHGEAIKSFARLPKNSSYENACDTLHQEEMDKKLKEIGQTG